MILRYAIFSHITNTGFLLTLIFACEQNYAQMPARKAKAPVMSSGAEDADEDEDEDEAEVSEDGDGVLQPELMIPLDSMGELQLEIEVITILLKISKSISSLKYPYYVFYHCFPIYN